MDDSRAEVLGRVCQWCLVGDWESGTWAGVDDWCGACYRRWLRNGECPCGYPVSVKHSGRSLSRHPRHLYCPTCSPPDKLSRVVLIHPGDERERVIYVGPSRRPAGEEPYVIQATPEQWAGWR